MRGEVEKRENYTRMHKELFLPHQKFQLLFSVQIFFFFWFLIFFSCSQPHKTKHQTLRPTQTHIQPRQIHLLHSQNNQLHQPHPQPHNIKSQIQIHLYPKYIQTSIAKKPRFPCYVDRRCTQADLRPYQQALLQAAVVTVAAKRPTIPSMDAARAI